MSKRNLNQEAADLAREELVRSLEDLKVPVLKAIRMLLAARIEQNSEEQD